jgi:hypothetical protein
MVEFNSYLHHHPLLPHKVGEHGVLLVAASDHHPARTAAGNQPCKTHMLLRKMMADHFVDPKPYKQKGDE